MRKRILPISIMLILLFLVGCGKTVPKNGDDVAGSKETSTEISQGNSDRVEVKKEGEADNVADGPLVITYTDSDYITVKISKELCDPENNENGFQISFLDENNTMCLDLYINAGKEFCQCKISYGDFGDTSKAIVSEFGKYQDLGDSVLFEIFLNTPGIWIAGGDNLTVPREVFEKPVSYMYMDSNNVVSIVDASGVFVFKVNENRIRAKETIDSILYTCDLDREYLTPTSEDYRVEIYDIPGAVVYRTASTIRPPGGVLRFGTDPSKDGELINVQVIRVLEYDKTTKGLLAYSEKTIFPSERDTICVVGTNFKNENHPYLFIDQHGVDYLPDDFEPHEALKTICDTLMPDYYSKLCDDMGIKCKMVRDSNVYYRKFYDLKDAPYGEDSYSYFAEYDLLGCTLRTEGPEFGAHNCEESGMTTFTKQYEYALPEGEGSDKYAATIYYSKPDWHKQEINYGENLTGYFPDEVFSMEEDADYFTPKTDDYIIIYIRMPYDQVICNENTALLSFDETGKLVEARYRLYKPDNMLNTMEELIEWYQISAGESELLYSSDNLAYFDITDCYDLRHNTYDGIRGDYLSKDEILNGFISENSMLMPGGSWSDAYGMFISKK